MTEVLGLDHIYIAVSDMAVSEAFYDHVLRDALGFRKKPFELSGDPHVQYFNRHFGFVLRPARDKKPHDPYAPGLHHLCLRVDTRVDLEAVVSELQAVGIAAMDVQLYAGFAPDYWATYFSDPDGLRLEVTNYRKQRRERFEHWDSAE